MRVRIFACLLLLLATWFARGPLVHAAEEESSPRHAHFANVLRTGRRRGRALLQQKGATLEHAPEKISASDVHTCVLASNGSAFCWGNNEYGQLGDGTTVGKSTPIPVKGDTAWTQISAGWNHTCALATNGSAFCWGNNKYGQLGDGTLVGKSTPTLVEGGTAWLQISAADDQTCALATNGSAFCWGNNKYGQLGDGTLVGKSTPTLVEGGTAWLQISAGVNYTCTLATNGSAFCWGNNKHGQLGDGTNGATADKTTPTPVKSGTAWTKISAGGLHACALATNGSAFCWGWNEDGQLGDDTLVDKSTPTMVKGSTAWTQISAGYSHTCALATNGSAFCWGNNDDMYNFTSAKYNSFGQLGDGTLLDKSTPIPVKSGTAWTQISAGYGHTCALATNGSAFCWGYNEYGQLGNGIIPDGKSTPDQVKGTFVASPSPGLSPLPPPAQSPAPRPDVSPAAIAGGVAGGVAVCVLIAAAASLVAQRRSKQRSNTKWPVDSLVLKRRQLQVVNLKASIDDSDPVLRWITSRLEAEGVPKKSSRNTHSSSSGSPFESTGQPVQLISRLSPTSHVPSRVRDLEFAWKDDVRIIHTLGSGSFGKVFLAEVRHASVAVKVLLDAKTVASASTTVASQTGTQLHELPKVSMASAAALMDEVAAMAPLHHVNVVHLLGFCTAPPALATEYCSRGSVYDMLQKARRDQETASSLSWGVRLRMAADAAAGMLHLHTRSPKPVIHRDVKTPNLLVTGDWVVKVADMGLSKLVEDVTMRVASATADNGGATNPRWLAPEALRGERSTAASDVFSFGVVMWELLTWRVPWDDANPLAIPFAVERGERLAVPDMAALPGFSDDERRTLASSVASYVALMRRCWAADPLARPTFLDIAAELRAALIDF